MVPLVAPPATEMTGVSTASSVDSALRKIGSRSTSTDPVASLRLGWRHSMLRWDRTMSRRLLCKLISCLLVFRRRARHGHWVAERLGIDLLD